MLNIRLPENLERKLAEEARLSHRSRSAVAREALALYLRVRRRRRQLVAMRNAAAALDEAEEKGLAEESLPLDEEAFAVAEEGADYEGRWWS